MGVAGAKQRAKLEHWYLRKDGHVTGKVYGHPAQDDGELITTSLILSPPDSIQEGKQIETRNTVYTLGTKLTK